MLLDLLLTPSLAALTRLRIDFLEDFADPPPSFTLLPFHLSHLELWLTLDDNLTLDLDAITLFEKFLLGSQGTLTTLVLRSVGQAPSPPSLIADFFSTHPFPSLRRLVTRGGITRTFFNLLPFLPALETLDLYDLNTDVLRTVFGNIARVAPPTLAALSIRDPYDPGESGDVSLKTLRRVLRYRRRLPNLRQLRLSIWFRENLFRKADDGVDPQAVRWRKLEKECEERSIGIFAGEGTWD